MIIKYVIQIWNPAVKVYFNYYETQSQKQAEKQYDKPYVKDKTRRMIKISEDVLYTDYKKRGRG